MRTHEKTKPPSLDEVAAIRARLDAALGTEALHADTSTAHGLRDLFLSEVRQQGWEEANQAWCALDDDAIRQLGVTLAGLMTGSAAPCVLPADTDAACHSIGAANVGHEVLGLDVDRPGLHHLSDLPPFPGGSNLTLLLGAVDEMSRDLPCRGIGLPTLVVRYDREIVHHLQFPPFEAAGRAVLQYGMQFSDTAGFCSFTREMVLRNAESIVHNMRDLWNNNRAIASSIMRARAAAARAAANMREVDVHAVTIDLNHQALDGPYSVGVEFATWDHALRRGIVVQQIAAGDDPDTVLSAVTVDRADEAAATRALGADGRIEGVARAIVVSAPQGPATVLAALADQFETWVVLPTLEGLLKFRLRWWHGRIHAETDDSGKLCVYGSELEVRDHILPHSIMASLTGQPLHVLFDQPFRCDSPISTAENCNGSLRIRVEPVSWLVDCRRGRMWPA